MVQNDLLHEMSLLHAGEKVNGLRRHVSIFFAEMEGKRIHVAGCGGFTYAYWEAWVPASIVAIHFDVDGYRNAMTYPMWANIKVYPMSRDKADKYQDRVDTARLTVERGKYKAHAESIEARLKARERDQAETDEKPEPKVVRKKPKRMKPEEYQRMVTNVLGCHDCPHAHRARQKLEELTDYNLSRRSSFDRPKYEGKHPDKPKCLITHHKEPGSSCGCGHKITSVFTVKVSPKEEYIMGSTCVLALPCILEKFYEILGHYVGGGYNKANGDYMVSMLRAVERKDKKDLEEKESDKDARFKKNIGYGEGMAESESDQETLTRYNIENVQEAEEQTKEES